MNNPVNRSFTIQKWGVRVSTLHRHVSVNGDAKSKALTTVSFHPTGKNLYKNVHFFRKMALKS